MGAPWHAAQAAADQRYQSAYLFGAICPARGKGAALSLPTPRLCSFTSTRSAAMWRAARTPCCYWTGRLAHDRQAESAEKHHAAAAAVASPGTQPGRERLAISACQLALQPRLRRLRRHHRRRLRGLAEAHRPTRNNHINRNARVGSRRLSFMTLGTIYNPAVATDPSHKFTRYLRPQIAEGWYVQC